MSNLDITQVHQSVSRTGYF